MSVRFCMKQGLKSALGSSSQQALENMCKTTIMVVNPSEGGKSFTKFMDKCDQGH